jgi:Phytanoyl-CoA dioxygenase (PhyH)
VSFTDEQVRAVKQQGFLCVPRLTSADEALTIRATLERLFRQKAGWNEGAYGELSPKADDDGEPNSPQIILPVNYAPELHQTECFQNAHRIARQILGHRAVFVLDMAIMKRAGTGEATPWHQDLAYRDPKFEYREVTIWVALRDVDEHSGCLKFLPGSHRGPLLEHRRVNERGESIALECAAHFDRTAVVNGVVPLGGCTIHFPRTLHCSTPNSSGTPRIVYIMTFGTAPVVSEKPESFPWRDNSSTEMQLRRRKWMRHGGAIVTVWRRLRRGDLRGWRTLTYLGSRAIRTVMQGQ